MKTTGAEREAAKQAPAWQDAANYPQPAKASNKRWAWEFLRRNAGYRADWQQYVAACWRCIERHPEMREYVEFALGIGAADFYSRHTPGDAAHLSGIWSDDELMLVYDPPLLEGESESQWRARMMREQVPACRITPLTRALGRKWGLRGMANPNLPLSTVLAFDCPPVVVMGPGFPLGKEMNALKREGRQRSDTHCALWIDLRVPLEKLQTRVMAAIKSERASRIRDGALSPVTKRFQRDKLRSYLQVLDAEAAGASVDEMVSALGKRCEWGADRTGRGAIRQWLQEAKRIRDGDWLALAMGNDPFTDSAMARGADEFLRDVQREQCK